MMTYAYNHAGSTDPALVAGVIPISPATSFSHVNVNHFTGYEKSDISEVRFYCQTSLHSRVVHFKTAGKQIGGAFDADMAGITTSDWNTGFTALSGHSANIPAVIDHAGSSTDFTSFAFYKGASNTSFKPRKHPPKGRHDCCAR